MAIDFFGWMGGLAGLKTTLYYVLASIPFIFILSFVYLTIRNKKIYKYKARVYRVRNNGKYLESNFKAGYINRPNSAPYFKIKTGWFKSVDLITTPNPKYIDEEDRVYYKQIDVNTFVQMKRKIEEGTVIMTPVESDVKYGAILSVQRIKEVLRLEPTWKKLLPYIGLVTMAVVFIVAYALLMDKCSG